MRRHTKREKTSSGKWALPLVWRPGIGRRLPGYLTRTAAQSGRQQVRNVSRATQPLATGNITPGGPNMAYEEAHATCQIITGNPDTVIRKLKIALDVVDPGSLVLWGREGPMSHEVAMRSIDLMTQEVIPAVKEYQADRERGRKSLASA